jgi:pimeloyl-ACP methyl ester carboxylesterase
VPTRPGKKAIIPSERSANQDELERFLTSNASAQLKILQDPKSVGAVRSWLGEKALIEYRNLISQAAVRHLARKPPNLLFIPGVMGSVLVSRGLGGVWWIDARTRHHLNDLRLSPDGLQDANPDHQIEPVVPDIGYSPFFSAAQNHPALGHVGFHYDWRKPLTASTQRLHEAVAEARANNGGHEVHLVAHSMGGLLVRAALMLYPDLWEQVGRIVFLGTPNYGSPAIAGYLKNHLWGFNMMSILGRYLDRTTFRSLWGILGLLPAPVGVYPGTRDSDVPLPKWTGTYRHPCANFDMYDATAWRLDLTPTQEQQLQTILNSSAVFHRELYEWHVRLDQEQRNRMAVIIGVGYKTLFRVAYRRGYGFLWERMAKETSRKESNPHRDGDGRVPLASAKLEWTGETRYVKAEHGRLPGVPAVYEDVFRFLTGERMRLPTTPQAALASHLAGQDPLPQAPHLSGVIADTSGDDPGYLQFESPNEATVAEIERGLETDSRPEFNHLHIL